MKMLHVVLSWHLIVLFSSALQASKVCYDKYECFNNSRPFNRKLVPLPQSPADVGTTFHLVTKSSSVVIDDSDVTKLQASSYDGKKKTVIIVHGWRGSKELNWILLLKTALLDKEDINLIITDWKKGAKKFYTTAVANTRLVGAQLAELIKFLNQQTKNSPSSFHLIGFSLGGHVVGYAGKRLNSKEVKVGRITGLDPAGPWFSNQHIDVRLDETDAAFVDVIHTNAGVSGIENKSGHYDFFPNNGRSQRGCKGNIKKSIKCNHFRAHAYYIESITSQCPFRSFRCSSWDKFTRGNCIMSCGGKRCPEMGYHAVNYRALAGGSFFLYTNQEKPYCVHRYVNVTFETKCSWLKIRIYGTSGRNTGIIEFEKRDLAAGSTQSFIAPIKMDLGQFTSIDVWNKAIFWKIGKVSINYVDNNACSYIATYNKKVGISPVKRNLVKSGFNC